jgi:hypothetical protein
MNKVLKDKQKFNSLKQMKRSGIEMKRERECVKKTAPINK